jgi:hypothetical protein
MMLGMTRGVEREEAQAADDDLLLILRDCELILDDGQKLTPERLHPISVNAGGTGDQFFGIEHGGM